MAESAFRGMIGFLDTIGIYDVVLPFVLVFTIAFAILEKTRVLGTEEIDKVKYTKKPLNALVAFVISFFVVGSGELVGILTTVSSQAVILLMASILFLLLVGSFWQEKEHGVFLEGAYNKLFMVIMFVGIVLIFLNAIKTKSGKSWLDFGWSWLSKNWNNNWVSAIIFLVIVIIFMYFVLREPRKKEEKKEKKE